MVLSDLDLGAFSHVCAVGWKILGTMELRVGNKYRLGRKIGSGSFGDIYLGEDSGQDPFLLLLLFYFDPHEGPSSVRSFSNKVPTSPQERRWPSNWNA